MAFLIDTSVASDAIRNPHGRPGRRLRTLGRGGAAVSVIVAAELRFGALRIASVDLAGRVEEFLDTIEVVPFESPADSVYASVRSDLEARGQPIGANDLFIAAHALALGHVLVTDNVREFSRVRGLKLENWLRRP